MISSVMIVSVTIVSELEDESMSLFNTMVNGACVREKKHVVKGPNSG